MKKLMMVLAAIAMAASAQATSSWEATGLDDFNGWSGALLDTTINGYGNDSSALTMFNMLFADTSAWQYTGATSWAEHFAVLASYTETAKITDGEVTIGLNKDASKQASASWIFFKDGITAGSEFILAKTALFSSDTATSAYTFDLSGLSASTALKSGYLSADAVPEPTSALLMLLGLAGLALKRKQA